MYEGYLPKETKRTQAPSFHKNSWKEINGFLGLSKRRLSGCWAMYQILTNSLTSYLATNV